MVSLRKRQEGFTIVELLIVIVIIGILATLVIVTFTGTQQKARNSQRQTDINAINSHLASYFAEKGGYPAIADLSSSSWIGNNMKGLDPEALVGPKSGDGTIQGTPADDTHYGYVAAPSGCATDACTSYTLTAVLEGKATTDPPYTKKSN